MADATRTTRFRFWLWLIAVIGVIVPRRLRADWRQEWEAELQYREALLAEWDKLDWRNKLDLLRRSLGAFRDALLLQPRRLEDEMFQDLRFGVRMLLKHKGFTFITVLTLALGIGANTAIFSVVYGVLLKPLPYQDAERVVVITGISQPDFRDVKASSRSFDWMAMWAPDTLNVTVDDETKEVAGAFVSPELLPMLSQPALGRLWRADEDTQPLAVLSHDYWQSDFGGEANVIGKTIRLYGKPHTVVGVMPPEFQFPNRVFKIWNTLGAANIEALRQMENRQLRVFGAVAHLKPGVTLTAAQAEMDTISQQLQRQYPDTNSGMQIRFASLYERIVGDAQSILWILLATVGFVLLIACANVANMTLSRMATREREIAIRTALGAGRRRVVRQLATESLLLAVIGGLFGLLLANWGLDALAALNPDNLPRLTDVRINLPVLLFTLGVSVGAGLIFGMVPAWQATRGNLNQMLREGGRGALGNAKGNRLRGALVVTEVALALMALAGAGLLLKSFNRLLGVDTGFKAENLLTVSLPMVGLASPLQRANVTREALARIAQIPGVQGASGVSALPPMGAYRETRFTVQGLPSDDGKPRSAYFITVGQDYFRTLGTTLYEGREFTGRDDVNAAKVVVINRALARTLFPNQSAVGKRLRLVNSEQSNEWREIVGVAGEVRYSGLDDPSEAAIYTPFAQTPFLWANLMIRTNVPPQSLIQSVRSAVKSVEPALEPGSFRTMEELVSDSVSQPRLYTTLLGAFALLALILAAIGIYGVIAYAVAQRTHEIGVRLALGAQAADVLRMVLRQGMTPVLLGLGLGLAGALATTRLLVNQLFGVTATDPATFAGVSFLLTFVALLACYLPARKATKVDPMIALRHD
jgi:putative ABC transport system permease protein